VVREGPTIREFLVGLFGTPAATEAEPAATEQATEYATEASFDGLFGGAPADEADLVAATSYAEAFATEGPDTLALRGMPAHRASSELSLDTVFKADQPTPASGNGATFSFDQFFSGELADAAPRVGGAERSASAPPDDIAQFNAWLTGLKKT
jgi:hypothetical protein